jgi:hypothetical protein
MTSEGHDHDHDRTAAPMVDEITDFEVFANYALRRGFSPRRNTAA